MQYSQKNLVRIIGNEQKNNGQIFWEILERIIGKISSIIGAGLLCIPVNRSPDRIGNIYQVFLHLIICANSSVSSATVMQPLGHW